MKRILAFLILLVALKASATTWHINGASGLLISNAFAADPVVSGDTVIFTNNLLGGQDSFVTPTNTTLTFNGNGLTNWGYWIMTQSPNNPVTFTNFVWSITNQYDISIGSYANEGYAPVRITGCRFTTPSSTCNIIAHSGPVVFDNNIVTNMPPYIQFIEPQWNGQDAVGDDGWTGIAVPVGTNDQFYIENCTFSDVGASGNNPNIYDGSCVCQCQYGARIVIRHSFLNYVMVDIHGSCTINGRLWALDSLICSNAQFCIRGGSGVICSNTGTLGFLAMGQECYTTYPALYQVGRGENQALFPAYIWANDLGITNTFSLNTPGYCAVFVTNNMVALNRDVYLTAPSYAYSPYQYPYFQSSAPTPVLMVIPNR